ncbi:hypothetical protein ONZ45_g2585 [Pleurotus djamor]|nr:hypothetical protein ONZ45_g2585 [Pleurotus djamor]
MVFWRRTERNRHDSAPTQPGPITPIQQAQPWGYAAASQPGYPDPYGGYSSSYPPTSMPVFAGQGQPAVSYIPASSRTGQTYALPGGNAVYPQNAVQPPVYVVQTSKRHSSSRHGHSSHHRHRSRDRTPSPPRPVIIPYPTSQAPPQIIPQVYRVSGLQIPEGAAYQQISPTQYQSPQYQPSPIQQLGSYYPGSPEYTGYHQPHSAGYERSSSSSRHHGRSSRHHHDSRHEYSPRPDDRVSHTSNYYGTGQRPTADYQDHYHHSEPPRPIHESTNGDPGYQQQQHHSQSSSDRPQHDNYPQPQSSLNGYPPRPDQGSVIGSIQHSLQHHHSQSGNPLQDAFAHAPPPLAGSDPLNELQHLGQAVIDAFRYSRCNGRKKAVCVGINYLGQRNELRGCINDAQHVRDFLIDRHGFKDRDILVLTDDRHNPKYIPTRENILSAMKWLVQTANCDDSLFFHYSGHGGRTPDEHGDEVDGYDEVIYPVDYDKAGHILDDTMHDIMMKGLPEGCRLTALFDASVLLAFGFCLMLTRERSVVTLVQS